MLGMTIRQKLAAGFVLVALLVGVVAYFGIHATNTVDSAFYAIAEEALPRGEALQDMRFAGIKIVAGTKGSLKATPAEVAQEEREIAEAKQLYHKAFSRYESLVDNGSPERQKLLEKIGRSGEELQEATDKITALKGTILSLEHGRFETRAQVFLKAVNDALSYERTVVTARKENLESSIATGKNKIIAASAITLVLALSIGLIISRSILVPVRNLIGSTQALLRGDFDISPNSGNRRDEIGQLASAFDDMAANLKVSYAGLERQVADRTVINQELLRANEEAQQATKAKPCCPTANAFR